MKSLTLSTMAMALAVLTFVPAARAQQAKLFLDGDIVRGNQPGGTTGPVCVLASQFKRGENVVFRIRVHDIEGKLIDDKGLKSVVVELSNGTRLPMYYGGHPPPMPTDHLWSAAWIIPGSHPTGTLTYKVVATDQQGQTATWQPPNILGSQLTVIPGAIELTRTPAP
jgi:hypothetical protein